MKIYFQLRQDHDVFPEVLESLKRQTVPCEIIENRTPGPTEESSRHYTPARAESERVGRCRIRDMAVASGDKYICMSDRDPIHLKDTNIEDGIKFLDEHPDYGAVSYFGKKDIGQKDEDLPHINFGFAMWRVTVLANMTFKNTTGFCLCYDVVREIRAQKYDEKSNYKFGYIDDLSKPRIKEIIK